MALQKTHTAYVLQVKSVHGNTIRVLDKYSGDSKPIRHQCQTCLLIWSPRPCNIVHSKNPTGCPNCSGNRNTKKSQEVFQAQTRAAGFTALTAYTTAKDKVRFQCQNGHIFETLPRNITSKKSGCPVCASNFISSWHNHDYLYKSKLMRKFPSIKWISGLYKTQNSTLNFACDKGHRFSCTALGQLTKSSFSTGCPVCDKSYNQSNVAIEWMDALSKKLRVKIQHARNEGEFRPPGTRYKLDGYNERYNVGFEFHGDYFHGLKNKNSDAYIATLKRNKELRKHVKLIVVWEYEWRQDKKSCLQRCIQEFDKFR